MNDSPELRSPVAAALALASQITTVAGQMALPPLGGYWLDRWLGTPMVFVSLGAVLGLIAGIVTVVRMGSGAARRRPTKDDSPPQPPSNQHLSQR